MTPFEYLQRYWNLEVPIENERGTTEWVTVKVAHYRLNEHVEKPREKFLDKFRSYLKEKGEKVTVKVMSAFGEEEKTFHSRAEIAPFVAAPFYGKGSPEDVQIVLQLAVRCGLIGKTQQEVQTYCDETDNQGMGQIGLDCNGFVGNFLWHTVGGRMWVEKPPAKSNDSWASSGIRSLLQKVGKRIKTIEDLVSNGVYVLGRVNRLGNIIDRKEGKEIGHVMISQSLTLKAKPIYMPMRGYKLGEVPSLQVIEATSKKGLLASTYDILEIDKNGIFRVWRGSKQEDMRVQIYRVFGF